MLLMTTILIYLCANHVRNGNFALRVVIPHDRPHDTQFLIISSPLEKSPTMHICTQQTFVRNGNFQLSKKMLTTFISLPI